MAETESEGAPPKSAKTSETTTAPKVAAKPLTKAEPKAVPTGPKAVPTEPSPARKYTAEFLGTFLLLFIGIGAAIFHAGPGGAFDEGFISLTVGLSIGVGIYAWGNISGGHYNPAVTFGFLVSGRLKLEDAVPYWVSQVLGGLTGLGMVYAIAQGYVSQPAGYCSIDNAGSNSIAQCTAMGATGFAGGGSPYVFDAVAVVAFEIIATFIFVCVILFVTDKDNWKGFHGLTIGLTLSILVLLGLNVDGLSVNPARSTASAAWAAVAGVNWPVDQLWVFWVAPFIGAAVAALVWRILRNPEVDKLP